MAAERKIEVGALTITIHPHSPERYIDLFKKSFRRKQPVRIRGSEYAILTGLHPLERDQSEPGPITGDIFRYTSIDPDANWFDTLTNAFATDEALDDVRIPENLKPNSARYSFVFFPDTHTLFYEGYFAGRSLSSRSAEKFFERLFGAGEVQREFGVVEVNHRSEVNALDEALGLHVKRRIALTTTRPNPDTSRSAAAKILARMDDQGIGEVREEYTAAQGMSIEPDQDLKTKLKVAAQNGSVSIKGQDSTGAAVEFSTEQHPWREVQYYNQDLRRTFDVFIDIAQQFNRLFRG